MCWFWQHEWKTIESYKQPWKGDFDSSGLQTVVILKCKNCGIHKRQNLR